MAKQAIYEILYIVNPQLGEAEVEEVQKHLIDTIVSFEGTIRREEKWGKRRLAYEIEKFRDGSYCFIEFDGTGKTVQELNDLIRIEGRIIRHLLTVVPKAKLAEDKRKAELAAKKAEEAEKEAAAAAQAEAERAAQAAEEAAKKAAEAAVSEPSMQVDESLESPLSEVVEQQDESSE